MGDKMILVGGLKGGEVSNTDCWLFDLKTNQWEVGKSGEEAIDDHCLVQADKNQLVIFGGFSGGTRVNSVRSAILTPPNKVEWTGLRGSERPSKTVPIPRNAHSAVAQGNSVFVFGGQDEDNNKMGDIWEFNITTKQWAQINYTVTGRVTDIARSGHAAVSYGSKMFIFGGILEVTKELNDLLVYDFKTQKLTIHEQREGGPEALAYASKLEETIAKNSINDGANSPHRVKTLAGSPLRKGIAGMSPNRRSTMG